MCGAIEVNSGNLRIDQIERGHQSAMRKVKRERDCNGHQVERIGYFCTVYLNPLGIYRFSGSAVDAQPANQIRPDLPAASPLMGLGWVVSWVAIVHAWAADGEFAFISFPQEFDFGRSQSATAFASERLEVGHVAFL